jgi:hypothetical protein
MRVSPPPLILRVGADLLPPALASPRSGMPPYPTESFALPLTAALAFAKAPNVQIPIPTFRSQSKEAVPVLVPVDEPLRELLWLEPAVLADVLLLLLSRGAADDDALAPEDGPDDVLRTPRRAR